MKKYCTKLQKEVKLLDCLACYFGQPGGLRKGPGNCGYCNKVGVDVGAPEGDHSAETTIDTATGKVVKTKLVEK